MHQRGMCIGIDHTVQQPQVPFQSAVGQAEEEAVYGVDDGWVWWRCGCVARTAHTWRNRLGLVLAFHHPPHQHPQRR